MNKLLCGDNLKIEPEREFDLIYADCIYESEDFRWIYHWWKYLKLGGVFIVQCDWHMRDEIGSTLKIQPSANHINNVVWKNEWGNHPKDRFHQCYDDILIYSKGAHEKFRSERVQVPKATAGAKGLNPSGRTTKTATAWIDDICLTTTAKERVRTQDGKLVRWQKPIELMHRVCSPFVDPGDWVADIFMGSGTMGVWCARNDVNYLGIEIDKDMFDIAASRMGEECRFGIANLGRLTCQT